MTVSRGIVLLAVVACGPRVSEVSKTPTGKSVYSVRCDAQVECKEAARRRCEDSYSVTSESYDTDTKQTVIAFQCGADEAAEAERNEARFLRKLTAGTSEGAQRSSTSAGNGSSSTTAAPADTPATLETSSGPRVSSRSPMTNQAGGFTLGASESATRATCLQGGGQWVDTSINLATGKSEKRRDGLTLFLCSRIPVDIFDEPGSGAFLSFCESALCEISISIPFADPASRLQFLSSKLEAKYGAPFYSEDPPEGWRALRTICTREGKSLVQHSWRWADPVSRLVLNYTCVRTPPFEDISLIYQDAAMVERRSAAAKRRSENY